MPDEEAPAEQEVVLSQHATIVSASAGAAIASGDPHHEGSSSPINAAIGVSAVAVAAGATTLSTHQREGQAVSPAVVASHSTGGVNVFPASSSSEEHVQLVGLYYHGAGDKVEEPLPPTTDLAPKSTMILAGQPVVEGNTTDKRQHRHLPPPLAACQHYWQGASRGKRLIWATVLLLVVAGLVLGIAVPLVGARRQALGANDEDGANSGNGSSSSSSSSNNDSSTTVVVDGNNAGPVPAPPSGTAAPTAFGPRQILRQTLLQILPPALYQRMTTDPTSSEYAAFQYLQLDDPTMVPPTLQRFVLALWSNAVGGTAFAANVAECEWNGVRCDDESSVVTSIQWNDRRLSGRLPDTILASLTSIDLGDNALRGTIPISWYQTATSLQYLYLHNNVLTGTISTNVAQWTSLRRLYLGGNQLTGSLPPELGQVRSLEYLMLQDNNLIGSLPSTWHLRNMYYLDLGNNQITGSVPSEWTGQMGLLRILYLDRNRLTGQLPVRFGDIGSGRLILLSIHSNAFTGTFPTFYNYTKKLIVVEIQNNGFTGMHKDMCKHSVYESGELVRMTADCGVCPCKNLCSADMCYDGDDNNTKRELF